MMDALVVSRSKIFAGSYRYRDSSSSRFLFRPLIRLYPSTKLVSVAKHSIALQHSVIRSFSSSSLSAESEVDADNVDAQDIYPSKTVHVKFVLQKECMFGQKFLLIGEDPIFGVWDPLNAIPLVWSDGHTWTAELDIPVGKSIQFKFLLKGITGEIEWQPDPDRVFRTWETKNTIVITEDWDDAGVQKITEDSMENANEESAFAESVKGNNGSTITEEIPTSMKKEENIIISEGGPVLVPGLAPTPTSTNEKGVTSSALTEEIPASMKKKENIIISEGGPVLVPGLGPTLTSTTEKGVTSSALTEEIPTGMKKEENIIISEGGPVLVPGWVPTPTSTTEKGVTSNAVTEEIPTSMKKEENIIINEGGPVLVPGLAPTPTSTTEKGVTSSALTEEIPTSMKKEENIIISEGGPVLVPGLAPMPKSTTEESFTLGTTEAFPKGVRNGKISNASVEDDETNHHALPELLDGPSEKQLVDGCEGKTPRDDKHEENSNETEESNSQPAADVIRNDIHWGHRTLNQLLLSLGFTKNQLT